MRTPVLLCVAFALVAASYAEGQILRRRAVQPVPAGPAARTVVVPEDQKPFTASPEKIVRLTGRGPTGNQITATVEGPARVVGENTIETVQGEHVMLGELVKEFEVKPTGKGKVTVTITAKFVPKPDESPKVTKYEFEVK